MTSRELQRLLAAGTAPWVVDVRSGWEYRAGHIPGAVHASFLRLLLRRATLPDDRGALLVVTCEHGPRALAVVSLLRRWGYRNLVLLEGQMAGWKRAGLPLERS